MKIEVVGRIQSRDGGKEHTVYRLRVSDSDGTEGQLQAFVRYSMLREFNSQLHKEFRRLQYSNRWPRGPSLPKFPPRRPLATQSPAFFAKRMGELQTYFDDLVELLGNVDLRSKVVEFLAGFVAEKVPRVVDDTEMASRDTPSQRNRRYRAAKALDAEVDVKPLVLGVGASGEVRLGQHCVTGLPCAVKSLTKVHLTAGQRKELESEVKVFFSLDHPHIARLEQVVETDYEIHLVMEHLQGGELFDRIVERGRYTEVDGQGATRQMLLAVAYLHAQGVAHCDLKPENFLYERKDSDFLKLIDFGFAKRWDGSTTHSEQHGTLDYVAPEVLTGSYTEKCDLFSMGVLVYILLCGCPPWPDPVPTTKKELRARKPYFYPPLWDALSSEARSFVTSLMVEDPDRRLSATEALRHPWLDAAAGADRRVDRAVVRSLGDFASASSARRACMSMLAWSSILQDVDEVRRQFLAFDRDGDGVISIAEFKSALGHIGEPVDDETQRLLECLDQRGVGKVAYSEFLAAAASSRSELEDDALRLLQSRFDAAELRDALGGVLDSCCREDESNGSFSESEQTHADSDVDHSSYTASSAPSGGEDGDDTAFVLVAEHAEPWRAWDAATAAAQKGSQECCYAC